MSTFKTTMQEDYNEMIKSVEKYGGFYISRYEMSRSSNDDTGTAQSKKNMVALTADNVYDLYGGKREWTLEAVYTYRRVGRGRP